MPYRKRDIQENRPPTRPHCPHFVFLLFMAIPHERKLAHLLQIEESVTHFFFPSLENPIKWHSNFFYNFWWHPDFLPLLAHILTWKAYNSLLVLCTYTMQYTQVKLILSEFSFEPFHLFDLFATQNVSLVFLVSVLPIFFSS